MLANDTAPAGETLPPAWYRPNHGKLTLDPNGDGGFIYVPTAGYSGGDSFVYNATDTNGLSASGTVNLTVTAAVPSATNDSYTTTENKTLIVAAPTGVLANDSAPLGETLTTSLVSGPSHGKLTLDPNGDGGFVYTPASGYSGGDSFVYNATDTSGLSASGTVNLTVTAASPATNSDSYTTAENTTLTVAALTALGHTTPRDRRNTHHEPGKWPKPWETHSRPQRRRRLHLRANRWLFGWRFVHLQGH